MGSRRKVALIYRQLLRDGVPEERLRDIHAPIGLDIGAVSPEEIAVSIMAEITMDRLGGSGRPMRDERLLERAQPEDRRLKWRAVSAILLAAGESTRMGRQKALLPWDGTTLIEYQLAQLARSTDVARDHRRHGPRAGAHHRDRRRVPDRARSRTMPTYRTGKVELDQDGPRGVVAGDATRSCCSPSISHARRRCCAR